MKGGFANEKRWQLPSNVTPEGTRCMKITIPDDDEWERRLVSAIEPLQNWRNHERDEAHNATIVAKTWRKIIYERLINCNEDTCELQPFWYDDPIENEQTDCDDNPDDNSAEWEAVDWAVSAFLFVTATPGAALAYKTFAPKIRNFFRAPSAGALCDIVVNGVLYATINTDAGANAVPVGTPIPQLIDIEAHNIAHNIIPFPQPGVVQYLHKLPAAGGGEPPPNYVLEIIRGRVKPIELCEVYPEGKPTYLQLASDWYYCYAEELPEMPIRQKPNYPCIMQQQQHDGSWLDVFNFSLCAVGTPGNVTASSNTYNYDHSTTNIENNYNEWNTGGQNINTFVPGFAGAGSVDRNKVMCQAFTFIIEVVKQAVYERYANPVTAGLIPALAGAIVTAGLAAVTGGAAVPAFAGSVVTVVGTAAAFLNGSIAVNAIEENRDAYICCLQEHAVALGAIPNATQFSTLFVGCESDTNILALFNAIFADIDVYLAFLKYCAELIPMSSAGLLPACATCPEPFEHVFDFTGGQLGWTIPEPTQTVYSGGFMTDATAFGQVLIRLNTASRSYPAMHVKLEFVTVAGQISSGNRYHSAYVSGSIVQSNNFTQLTNTSETQIREFDVAAITADRLEIGAGARLNGSGSIKLVKATYTGLGDDPFV